MRLLLVLVGVVVVSACSDDDSNKLTPDTLLSDTPAALSNAPRARFTFRADRDANAFLCRVDGGDLIDCISPFEVDVADGPHTFEVAAALNQNIDLTPAMHAWTVDATAPETTITTGPPALDNSTTPTFAFAADDAAATFECALDGAAFAACTSPAQLTVAGGNHVFRVRALDALGNADASPAEHAWELDDTAPDTTITVGPADAATTGSTATFEFAASEPGATLECALDAAAFVTCTSPLTFADLPDGSHTFAVRARDPLGVDPSPATRTWTVDATPPDVRITSTPMNPSNDPTPTFAFTSADAAAMFECQLDGVVTFASCASPWTSPALLDGPRIFRVRATDPFGNVAVAATYAWTVDLTPPQTTFVQTEPALTTDPTGDFAFTASQTGANFECRLDGGAFTSCTTPFATAVLADGAHTFEVRAIDPAGNADPSPATHTWTIDTSAPDTTITSAPGDGSATTATFAFTASEGGATFECQLDTTAFAACTSPRAYTSLTGGTHTFRVRARDAAGHVDASPAMHTWTIDTTPPATTITAAPASLSNDPTPSIQFTSEQGARFECRLGTAAFAACASPFTTTLGDGTYTFAVRAIDAVGNVDPSPATVTFAIDTTAPVVTITDAPPAKWPVNYYAFGFTASEPATFTCALNGATATACASGTRVGNFPYGTTSSYLVTATDGAGNVGTRLVSWSSDAGLVLHYPWEQGDVSNTSLLAQRPSYSPSGAGAPAFLGGWAGTALGRSIPAHAYKETRAVLTSSPSGTYAVSLWVRPTAGSNGTLVTTAATGGFRLSMTSVVTNDGALLTLTAFGGGTSPNTAVNLSANRWHHVALRTADRSTLELWVNGAFSKALVVPGAGFDANQANDVTVGPVSNVDLDDLRFYNAAITNAEMCTLLARGLFANSCSPLVPGVELDMEGRTVQNTGAGSPLFSGFPGTPAFVPFTTGDALKLPFDLDGQHPFAFSDMASYFRGAPGRSISLWFDRGGPDDVLFDLTGDCGQRSRCGLRAEWKAGVLTFQARAGAVTDAASMTLVGSGPTSVLVTEQRANGLTSKLSIYVDGRLAGVLDLASGGDVFGAHANLLDLPKRTGTVLDELEVWPDDLSRSPAMLCENGLDGEYDALTGQCSLTSN